MYAWVIAVIVATIAGCQARPDARWEQVGKTPEQARRDYRECRVAAMRGMESPGGSESRTEEDVADCMERKGYREKTWDRFVCCNRLLGS
ncbi:hypothetical protein [Nitrospira moscoviensis]|uniref:Uncharacterized protein n=1 Tax=Nitrospira moscoviensis TaxID=42253 RepID=A0A0K2GEW2_NITMO|nr:hypothetical protein [Nitrospira moscoviensis]ALA59394.1 hypothetical protein NITMOv2_2989 [Nitrospira moscoviensis]